MDDIEKLKKFLEDIDENDIIFSQHFYEHLRTDRPKIENLVKTNITKTDKLLNVERQQPRSPDEKKFRLEFKLSRKYCLIIIIVAKESKLQVITAWNRLRK